MAIPSKFPPPQTLTKAISEASALNKLAGSFLGVIDNVLDMEELMPADKKRRDAQEILFQSAAPTFLFMKLNICTENLLDALWQTRFPEIKASRLHFDEKLKILNGLHDLDLAALQGFRKIRNECAHDISAVATWQEFSDHTDSVIALLKYLLAKAKRAHKRR